MLQRSVYEKGWTLEVFSKLLRDPSFGESCRSREQSASSSRSLACCSPIRSRCSWPAAANRRANLLIILVLIPFWTSILVRTYAWMVLLGRRGIINDFLVGSGLIDQPLRLPQHALGGLRCDGPCSLAVHGAADLLDIEELGLAARSRRRRPRRSATRRLPAGPAAVIACPAFRPVASWSSRWPSASTSRPLWLAARRPDDLDPDCQ